MICQLLVTPNLYSCILFWALNLPDKYPYGLQQGQRSSSYLYHICLKSYLSLVLFLVYFIRSIWFINANENYRQSARVLELLNFSRWVFPKAISIIILEYKKCFTSRFCIPNPYWCMIICNPCWLQRREKLDIITYR